MNNLNEVKWNEFFIGGKDGIFSIKATKSGIDKNKLNMTKGNIPYITRSEANNGIDLFITDSQNPKYKKDEGNVITIGLDTQTVFYQKNEFFTGQNIQVLRCKNLNYYSAMFIIPLLKIQMEKFSWGSNGATLGRLNRTKIMLPVDDNGNPNWSFMENFIKEKELPKIKTILSFYNKKLLDLIIDSEKLLIKPEWKKFTIDDIFSTKKVYGKELSKHQPGKVPYISTSSLNNGLISFVNPIDEKSISKGQCISVDPISGKSFYHNYDFIGRGFSGASINLLYNENLNEFNAKFVITCIEQVSKSYASYARLFNSHRLKNGKLQLPVDNQGNPYWSYMENFIKAKERVQIEKIIKHFEKRLVALQS